MTIAISTNHPEFINDLAEEARIFFDAADIKPRGQCASHDLLIEATLSEDGSSLWCAETKITDASGQITAAYSYESVAATGTELIIKRYLKRYLKISVFRALKRLKPDIQTPWGSLTGIRPTRLLRELENLHGKERARDFMLCEFDVTPEKYALSHEINRIQSPFIADAQKRDADIYIGIPYCKTRCLYCSFLSGIRTGATDMDAYIRSLKRDISHGAMLLRNAGYRIKSLYVGGGTPTVLTPGELYDALSHCIEAYGLSGDTNEITVEAGRPDTIDAEKLRAMRSLGVSRISINPQTMNQNTLDAIGRSHSVSEIYDCFSLARDMGFVINMDVILCLPGETVHDVQNTLERVLALLPQNLTVHTLALKRSSRLKQALESYPLPDAGEALAMTDMSSRMLKSAGFRPYYMYRQKYMRGNLENVGYALPGFECAYNIDMMEETVSIMAHGAGAMTKRVYPGRDARVERLPNPKDPDVYANKLDRLFLDKEKLFWD